MAALSAGSGGTRTTSPCAGSSGSRLEQASNKLRTIARRIHRIGIYPGYRRSVEIDPIYRYAIAEKSNRRKRRLQADYTRLILGVRNRTNTFCWRQHPAPCAVTILGDSYGRSRVPPYIVLARTDCRLRGQLRPTTGRTKTLAASGCHYIPRSLEPATD